MDNKFMQRALELAQMSADEGEVPVGCVIVRGSEIVGEGRNRRETKRNALCHAEIEAINNACSALGGWRLWECEMFVTLEPCPMCAGAVINSRIKKVTFGAYDKKAGSFGSIADFNSIAYNHHCEIKGGVLEEECKEMLSSFFKALRESKNKQAD